MSRCNLLPKLCVKDLVTRVNELESFKAVNEQVSLELKSENKRLQERLDNLSNAIDDQEQRNRNNCLLLHGVEEMDGENTDDVVLKIINERLELPIVLENIHRALVLVMLQVIHDTIQQSHGR